MKSRRHQAMPIAAAIECLEPRLLLTTLTEPTESPLDYNDTDQQVQDVAGQINGNRFNLISNRNANSNSAHLDTGIYTVDQGAASSDINVTGITVGTVSEFTFTTATQVAGGRLREVNVKTVDGRRSQATINLHIEGTGFGVFFINTYTVATNSHTYSTSSDFEATTHTGQSSGRFSIVVYGNYSIDLTVTASTTQLDEVYGREAISGRGSLSAATTKLELASTSWHVVRFQTNELVTSSFDYQDFQTGNTSSLTRSAHIENNIFAVGLYHGIDISSNATERSYSGTLETDDGGQFIRTRQLSAGLNIEAPRYNWVYGTSVHGATAEYHSPGTTYETIRIQGSGSHNRGTEVEDNGTPLGTQDEKDEVFIHFEDLADNLFGLN